MPVLSNTQPILEGYLIIQINGINFGMPYGLAADRSVSLGGVFRLIGNTHELALLAFLNPRR